MNGHPQTATDCVIGFNLLLGRIATMRLLHTVSFALERGSQSITICLSSMGGDPEQAFYAYEILRALRIPIVTYNVGTVQSAAMAVFLAGSVRLAAPHSHFLMNRTMHSPPARLSYAKEHLDHSVDSIVADDERMLAIVSERTNQPMKAVRRWHVGQKLRSTEFARTNGIIHEVKPVRLSPRGHFLQVTLSEIGSL